MAARFAVELVNAAAIRAFDAAVGLDGQKHARVTVPSFVFGAGTMQRQIVRSDVNHGVFLGAVHKGSLAIKINMVSGSLAK